MDKDLENTQPLPKVNENSTIKSRQGKVRELDPVDISGYQESSAYNAHAYDDHAQPPPEVRLPQEQPKRRGSSFMKIALLVIGFAVAFFLGAAVSGYHSEQEAKKQNLAAQGAAAVQQIEEADSQEISLSGRKEKLEARYQELLEKQQEAQRVIDKLSGQREQLEKSQKEKSSAGKVIDKITGDSGKQKKEAAETAKKEAEAQEELDAITESLQAAGAAIEEVDAQLENLEEMRQQAKKVKEDVDRAYSENKDTIDTVLHYVSLGLSLLSDSSNKE